MDDKIFWPPEEETAMSVLGFSEVDKATHEIIIDETLTLNIASLAGIFLLKIVAWNDRHMANNKDADDLGFILRNYFNINQDRIVKQHFDLYDDNNFSIVIAGASLIGRDIAEILKDTPTTRQKIVSILNTEVQKQDESQLINQVMETNRMYRYEETLRCFQNVIRELNEYSDKSINGN